MEFYKENSPAEEIIDNGLGVFVRKKTLYHGSAVAGIDTLQSAEETTIGEGVYFTDSRDDADGYAHRRMSREEGSNPVVYEAVIENIKLIDLRSSENVKKILPDLLTLLKNERAKEGLGWAREGSLDETIEKILNGAVGAHNLREVGFAHGILFTEYVKGLGYDGIIAREGGEGNDVGDHETYLIFDADKIQDLHSE